MKRGPRDGSIDAPTVRKLLADLGLTACEAADHLGVEYDTVLRWRQRGAHPLAAVALRALLRLKKIGHPWRDVSAYRDEESARAA